MYSRAWRHFSDALSRSPRLTVSMIVLSTLFAVIFGAYLTPATNVSAIPFVLPIVFAIFQHERWVWVTTALLILIYIPVAFVFQSIVVSVGLVNLIGFVVFGLLFSRVAEQRQRLNQHAASLERMEEDIRFTMRHSNVRLFSHDTELHYTWVPNPLSAFSREQMLGQTDAAMFPPDEARELMAVKQRALDEEREVTQDLILSHDGDSRIIRLTVVPTYTNIGGNRQKTGITCVSVDLTDLHRTIRERDELVQQQQEALAETARAHANLEAFTSLVAHDLRQPLTVMQGYADLLRRQFGDELADEQHRVLAALDRSIEQMTRLVGDLRDVAALEQGRFTVNLESADLVSVVHEVISDYTGTIKSQPITYCGPDSLYTEIDWSRMSQLIGNLLNNAIKYSPDGGEIRVEVVPDGEACLIHVRDYGVGIESKDREQLFEMFSRLENARAVQGLGLGLYISKAIAEAHDGSIEVESQPGSGSTFTVRLPVALPAKPLL